MTKYLSFPLPDAHHYHRIPCRAAAFSKELNSPVRGDQFARVIGLHSTTLLSSSNAIAKITPEVPGNTILDTASHLDKLGVRALRVVKHCDSVEYTAVSEFPGVTGEPEAHDFALPPLLGAYRYHVCDIV